MRLASLEALAGLLLLVRSEDRLAAKFDAVRLGVGPAARGAFENASAFELRRDAKDRKDDLGEVGRGIEERLGQRPDTSPGALHVPGDNQKVGRVAGEALNGRGEDNIAGREGLEASISVLFVAGSMVIFGAAKGVARALEQGLEQKLLKIFGVAQERTVAARRTAGPGPSRPKQML